jgi:ABC-type multidrug transport system fused ATPase/permease subunit
LSESGFGKSFHNCVSVFFILPRFERIKLSIISIAQLLLSLLDLVGVMLVGLFALLTISPESLQVNNSNQMKLIVGLGLIGDDFDLTLRRISIVAIVFLLCRTFFSLLIMNYTFKFLAKQAAKISSQLTRKVLNLPMLELRSFSSQDLAYSLTLGVDRAVLGVLGTFITLLGDITIVIVLFMGLFLINYKISLIVLIFYSIIALLVHKFSSKSSSDTSRDLAHLNNLGLRKIVEILSSIREIKVRNQVSYYSSYVADNRHAANSLSARMSFVPYIGKYLIETSVIVGAVVLSALAIFIEDRASAISIISLFLAASTRMAPAILRVQQSLLQILYSSGQSELTLTLVSRFRLASLWESKDIKSTSSPAFSFSPKVEMRNVHFTYGRNSNFQINIPLLEIFPGQIVAIAGSSGSGKSTLADLILGVIEPDSGEVRISDSPASSVAKIFPGAISYVPQDVITIDGTLRENVSLGHQSIVNETDVVIDCLNKSGLSDLLQSLPDGIDTQVGEWGSMLSGGQRQRLGIARALFTDPKLVIFDEATSSLDSITEQAITSEIMRMRGIKTVVIIAHRLSTIREADVVIFLSSGKLVAQGTFQEVKNQSPEFEAQAALLGL